MAKTMNPSDMLADISRFWDEAIVPALIEYIRIPAKSPRYGKVLNTEQ